MAQQVQWGSVILHLDNEAFRKGFSQPVSGISQTFTEKLDANQKSRSMR